MATTRGVNSEVKRAVDDILKSLEKKGGDSKEQRIIKKTVREAAQEASNAVKKVIEAEEAEARKILLEAARTKNRRDAVDSARQFVAWAGAKASCNGAECGFGCGTGCAVVCIASGGAGTAIAAAGGTAGGSGTSIAINRIAAPSVPNS